MGYLYIMWDQFFGIGWLLNILVSTAVLSRVLQGKEQEVFRTIHYFFVAAIQFYTIWVQSGHTLPSTRKAHFFRQQGYKQLALLTATAAVPLLKHENGLGCFL